MVYVDKNITDSQINISAVPQDFFVGSVEGKNWLRNEEI